MSFAFDLLSDIHIDFYVGNYPKFSSVKDFADKVFGRSSGRVLVIAGDIGHLNEQNLEFLEESRKRYDFVIATAGNHDLYIFDEKFPTSIHRLAEMEKLANSISGVYYFSGLEKEPPVVIDSFSFYGNPMWYDLALCEKYGFTFEMCVNRWKKIMSDSRFIYLKSGEALKQPRDLFKLFSEGMTASLDKATSIDILVTHIPVLPSAVRNLLSIDSHFYFFNGHDLLDFSSVFVFGHIHNAYEKVVGDVRFVANPLGYPGENGLFTGPVKVKLERRK